jgi:endonuclease/exonuclease/phosphatase family metal-dependent hydrolase
VRLLSYNIRYGGSGREAPLAEVVRAAAPDLVVLQEATRPDVVEQVAAAAGLRAWGARPGHSLAFMSRVPPEHHQWHWPRSSRHAFLEIVPSGSRWRIFGVHLSAIHANWTERRRARELRALLEAIEPSRGECHVLTGDFNTLAPGEALELKRLPPRLRPFVWLSGGTIGWHVVQILLDAGYADACRTAAAGEPPGHTFPTWDPHLRLDYAFLPAGCIKHLARCSVVSDLAAARRGSDHFPLLVELTGLT